MWGRCDKQNDLELQSTLEMNPNLESSPLSYTRFHDRQKRGPDSTSAQTRLEATSLSGLGQGHWGWPQVKQRTELQTTAGKLKETK